VRALTRWGTAGCEGLVHAAEDESKLVRAVAWHALLHLGVSDPDAEPWAPLRPLLTLRDDGLAFASRGGCNARIGPIEFTRVPLDLPLSIAVSVGHFNFDPFTIDAEFSHSFIPPEMLASDLLWQSAGDWLTLAARWRWIVEQTAALIDRLDGRSSLRDLEIELRQRALRYAAFAEQLSKDLGIDWQVPVGVELTDAMRGECEATYLGLRRLFARSNRQVADADLHLERTEDPPPTAVEANVAVGTVDSGATVCGVLVEEIAVGAGVHAVTLRSAVSAKTVSGSVTGVAGRALVGSAPLVPTILRIESALSIGVCLDGATCGIVIDQVDPGFRGWRPELALSIDRLDGGIVRGIVAPAV
jgi:hypothetical protein